MIVFDLKCSKGHAFEEWFDSSGDYEAKSAAGDIVCPDCGSKNVTKAMMAPNVRVGMAASPRPACGASPACADAATCPMAGRG
ncbi:MAG: hypothetical protein A3G18_10960 [Rhodospirillales bacterium RIFCSPLOWO2_12_FULL_58_28]|nr:MAG: hypothetical protein A3H92_03610 [Rhodospirillales bacterium RIFCSPLOWO2_02_FULL_58_16]OHC77725.1 MAG: hypothetical protein A3G18_10960 [Rhodospirillales bacterium RIFCSPLOWO2_12_FULL_58_28]